MTSDVALTQTGRVVVAAEQARAELARRDEQRQVVGADEILRHADDRRNE